MLHAQTKSPRRIVALLAAVVLALSLIPITRAHAAGEIPSYPILVNDADLEGATAGVENDFTHMSDTQIIYFYITPNPGKQFQSEPDVTVSNAIKKSSLYWDDREGCYYIEIGDAFGPVTITVTGEATDAKYPVSLDTSGLKGASASASPATEVVQGASVTVSIQAAQGKEFVTAPTVTATGATAGAVDLKNGVYVCDVANAVGPTVNIVVSGEAKGDPTATLDISGLKGATAALDKTSGIKAGDTVVLTVTPEAGKTFSEAPRVVATNATVGQSSVKNGAYTFPLTGFTGDAVVTVTGEAKGSDPVNPDIKIGGNGTHTIGSGGTLTVTCSLPLEDLIDVYVDNKKVDPSNYDKKSGSTIVTFKAAFLDTLAPGKHLVKLAYTGGREASVEFTVVAKGGGKADPASGSKLAKTGDPLAAPVAGMAGVAALATIAGAAALRRKRDAE